MLILWYHRMHEVYSWLLQKLCPWHFILVPSESFSCCQWIAHIARWHQCPSHHLLGSTSSSTFGGTNTRMLFFTTSERRMASALGFGTCICSFYTHRFWIVTFHRPIADTGERVPPSDLSNYRVTHEFQGPYCLCACDAIGTDYTESMICVIVGGQFSGEYVASCATETCGYSSKSDLVHAWKCIWYTSLKVLMERMYMRIGLLVKRYAFQGKFVPLAISMLTDFNCSCWVSCTATCFSFT